MFSYDIYLPVVALLTHLAEAYSEGSYGGGQYNQSSATTDTSPTSPAPVTSQQASSPTVTTTQVSEIPVASSETPTNSAGNKSYQTTSQPAASIETERIIGNDPMWIIIAGSVTLAALIAIVILFTKRFLRRS